MSDTRRRKDGDAGFTLLELLVAMTLLAMVFSLIAGGIGFGAAVWEKGGASAKRAGDLQTAHRVLRRRIEAMQPLRQPAEQNQRQANQPLTFQGGPESLVFVGPPPAELALPGVYRYRIAIAAADGKQRLTLEWRRLQPDLRDFGEKGGADTGAGAEIRGASGMAVLMEGLSGGRIEYFGAINPDDVVEWRDRWEPAFRLPDLVRLTVDFPDGDPREWPPLIAAPMIDGGR